MLEEVIEFVALRCGIPKFKITKELKIESDFGMAGLDTIQFYEEFFEVFKIQNPEDFDMDRYVTSENLEFKLIVKSLFSKIARQKFKTKDISIGHLAKVAETKYWVEEIKTPANNI